MTGKNILIGTAGILVIVFLLLVALNLKKPGQKGENTTVNQTITETGNNSQNQTSFSSMLPTLTPTPIPPVKKIVKNIDASYITVTNNTGDLLIPNDESKVSVFKLAGGQKTSVTLADIAVGQNVTVIVDNVRKHIDFIIEE